MLKENTEIKFIEKITGLKIKEIEKINIIYEVIIMEFHTIKYVKPLENMIIKVIFENGEIKKYNIKALIKKYEVFKELNNKELFDKVKVDIGGYGIVWNEEVDLSSEEIWEHGY